MKKTVASVAPIARRLVEEASEYSRPTLVTNNVQRRKADGEQRDHQQVADVEKSAEQPDARSG